VLDFLYGIPSALLLFLALALSIALACAGQVYVHRRFNSGNFVAHNEVGGITITVSGAIYAVILGFLTVSAWEHFQEAREIVVQEADANIDVWHMAVGLPQAARARVRDDMVRYATIMSGTEWPLMKHGSYDPNAAMIGMDAIDATGTFKPTDSGEANAQNATLQQLNILHDARQRRVTSNDSGVSGFEWLVLSIGAACIVCFCWLFGLNNMRTQLLMTATVVTMIVSILVLLFDPFRGDTGIGPDSWNGALEHIHEMQTGAMPGMKM
jgi:Protein of unknown function (DUF4239)